MKKRTKRAILLVKKYTCFALYYFLVGASIAYSLHSVISWGKEQIRIWKEPKVVGEYLTENLRTVEKDGMVEIYNEELKKVVGRYPKVFVQNYGGSIMVVNEEDLFGFISPMNGDILVEPQYLLAWDSDMSSGLAACVNREHKLGFINVDANEIVIPFNIDIDPAYFENVGDYPYFEFMFHGGYSLVPGKNGCVGIIDEAGEMVLAAEYSDIRTTQSYSLKKSWFDMPKSKCALNECVVQEGNSCEDYDFDNPIIVERTDSTGVKYGAFDIDKGMIIPIDYDNIAYAFVEFDDNLFICQKNGMLQILNENGDIVCDRTYFENPHYSDNIHVVLDSEGKPTKYIMYNTLNSWAVMDTDFRIVIMPNNYWEIRYLGNGIFVCENENGATIWKDITINRLDK